MVEEIKKIFPTKIRDIRSKMIPNAKKVKWELKGLIPTSTHLEINDKVLTWMIKKRLLERDAEKSVKDTQF